MSRLFRAVSVLLTAFLLVGVFAPLASANDGDSYGNEMPQDPPVKPDSKPDPVKPKPEKPVKPPKPVKPVKPVQPPPAPVKPVRTPTPVKPVYTPTPVKPTVKSTPTVQPKRVVVRKGRPSIRAKAEAVCMARVTVVNKGTAAGVAKVGAKSVRLAAGEKRTLLIPAKKGTYRIRVIAPGYKKVLTGACACPEKPKTVAPAPVEAEAGPAMNSIAPAPQIVEVPAGFSWLSAALGALTVAFMAALYSRAMHRRTPRALAS